jgi:MFS family permease
MKLLWGMTLSLFLINLAAILERADESLLPAVYKEVSEAFKASPSELGTLTFIRTIVQALCSPLAGILAMRYYRPSVIGLGTLFWALSTAAVALSFTFTQCAFSRALNGVGLAIVVPALQSFIADSYTESGRGVAFGWLNLVGGVGGIAGSTTATIMAGYNFGVMPGWRVAFFVVAIVSALIGWLVHIFVIDPRDNVSSGVSGSKGVEG